MAISVFKLASSEDQTISNNPCDISLGVHAVSCDSEPAKCVLRMLYWGWTKRTTKPCFVYAVVREK